MPYRCARIANCIQDAFARYAKRARDDRVSCIQLARAIGLKVEQCCRLAKRARDDRVSCIQASPSGCWVRAYTSKG